MYTDTISIVGSKKRGRKPLPLEEKRTSNLKAYHREYYKKQPLEYLCKENKRERLGTTPRVWKRYFSIRNEENSPVPLGVSDPQPH